jgi:hypothetical protein
MFQNSLCHFTFSLLHLYYMLKFMVKMLTLHGAKVGEIFVTCTGTSPFHGA